MLTWYVQWFCSHAVLARWRAYGNVVGGQGDGGTVDIERHLLGHGIQIIVIVHVNLYPHGRAGLHCSHGIQGGGGGEGGDEMK